MDAKYLCGIPEIDAQHEELQNLVTAVLDLIAKKDQRHLLHPALRRLNQLLVTHFEYEETLMARVNYQDLPQHAKTHKGVLKIFNDYFARPRSSSDYDYFGKVISEKVLGHVMEHDIQMTARVREYLANPGSTSGAPPG
jgi:hemerythrin-like metal-binding protein